MQSIYMKCQQKPFLAVSFWGVLPGTQERLIGALPGKRWSRLFLGVVAHLPKQFLSKETQPTQDFACCCPKEFPQPNPDIHIHTKNKNDHPRCKGNHIPVSNKKRPYLPWNTGCLIQILLSWLMRRNHPCLMPQQRRVCVIRIESMRIRRRHVIIRWLSILFIGMIIIWNQRWSRHVNIRIHRNIIVRINRWLPVNGALIPSCFVDRVFRSCGPTATQVASLEVSNLYESEIRPLGARASITDRYPRSSR